MKKFILALAFVAGTAAAMAQSHSYNKLKERFRDHEEVFSISIGGFWCRMALNLAGEHEFKEAVREINHIRFITIPRQAFQEEGLTVKGFRQILREDRFQELVTIRDHGDHVGVYLQQTSNKKDRYFVLIEEETNVVAIEIKGNIDIDKLKQQPISYNR